MTLVARVFKIKDSEPALSDVADFFVLSDFFSFIQTVHNAFKMNRFSGGLIGNCTCYISYKFSAFRADYLPGFYFLNSLFLFCLCFKIFAGNKMKLPCLRPVKVSLQRRVILIAAAAVIVIVIIPPAVPPVVFFFPR